MIGVVVGSSKGSIKLDELSSDLLVEYASAAVRDGRLPAARGI